MKDIVIRLNNLFSWKAIKTKTSETSEHNNKHKKMTVSEINLSLAEVKKIIFADIRCCIMQIKGAFLY